MGDIASLRVAWLFDFDHPYEPKNVLILARSFTKFFNILVVFFNSTDLP